MSPAETVFFAALGKADPAERAAYLNAACGAYAELRRQVERLLAAHPDVGSFLHEDPVQPSPLARVEPGEQVGATVEGPAAERAGTVIGPYKLLQEIGEGGMGTVWMAQQQEPVKRVVALKLIKAGMDSRQVITRFEAERQALALMDHPNIARVLDGGTTKGESGGVSPWRPYFVMDLVKGVPITRYCDEHHLTPRQRLELFVPVCQAVQHAHQKGIIHRDLKPSNVLVALYDGKPVPKVIDFGVAKAAGQSLTDKPLVTDFGNIIGTLEYMSPEQAEVNQLDIDTRSDIYSLGVLLYELLTGSPPFTRKDLAKAGMLEMLRVIREQEPSRPSTKLSTSDGLPTLAANRGTEPAKLTKLVRGELDWIVMKAMEKDRGRRYETANGFAMDVQRFLADEPVLACPPSVLYRFRKFARRNRGPVLAASLVLLAMAAGIVGTTWGLIQKDAALGEARNSERKAQDQSYLALFSQARALRSGGQAGQRFDSLKALDEAAHIARARDFGEEEFLKLRNEAIACLALPDSRLVKSTARFGRVMALDPTFTYYAGSDSNGNISVFRVADGQLITVLRAPPGALAYAYLLRYSPNGRFLAATHHRSYKSFVWQVDSGEIVWKTLTPTGGNVLDFSPDSRRVAVTLPAGGIGLVDLQSGKEEQRFAVGESPCFHACAFDPQGQRLAVATEDKPNVIRIYELPGDSVREIPMPLPARRPDLAWTRDGTLLAAARDGGVVCVVDTRDGAEQARLTHPGALLERVAFDPTSELVVTTGWNDNALRVWHARTGKLLLSKFTNSIAPQFSRDGRMIACDAGKLELWEVTTGQAACHSVGIPSSRGGSGTVDFHHSGRVLAVGHGNGVSLWDCRDQREIAFLEAKGTRWALFDPGDGSLLVSGLNGLHRRPIRRTAVAGGAELVIGPPRQVIEPADVHQVSVPAGSGLLALTDHTHGQAVLLSWPGAAREIARVKHRGAAYCALSPSGKWLAIGTWWGEGAGTKVYDARTGNLVWTVPHEGDEGVDARVAFSPDEHWLITGDGPGYRFWHVNSWAPALVISAHGRALAFTPDGAIAAITQKPHQVTLIEVTTGRELASLALGGTMDGFQLSFSPDGTRLAVSTGVHSAWFWDLRHVRQQLSGMGLDWDQPSYAPVRNEDDLPITQVTVLSDQAQEPMLKLEPAEDSTARGRNNRAWALVASSMVKADDARAAVKLAQKAVAEKPECAAYWNTLGVAHYRAGALASAALALEKSLKLGGNEDSDLLFLAMVQWQQGDKKRACESFDRACQWMDRKGPQDDELLRFREEAAVLLGLIERSASGKK
jgi:serine/threonine protein kinase/WD40 repeat protein